MVFDRYDTCQIPFIPVSYLIIPAHTWSYQGHTSSIPCHTCPILLICSSYSNWWSYLLISLISALTCHTPAQYCSIYLVMPGLACPTLFIPAPYLAIPGIHVAHLPHTWSYASIRGHTWLYHTWSCLFNTAHAWPYHITPALTWLYPVSYLVMPVLI